MGGVLFERDYKGSNENSIILPLKKCKFSLRDSIYMHRVEKIIRVLTHLTLRLNFCNIVFDVCFSLTIVHGFIRILFFTFFKYAVKQIFEKLQKRNIFYDNFL